MNITRVRLASMALVASNFFVVIHGAAGAITATEGFNYAAGAALNGQNGGSGFGGNWAGSTLYTIGSGSLTDPTGLTISTGNSVVAGVASGNRDAERTLTSPLGTAGTTAYVSFLLQPQGTVGAGFDSGHFGLILENSGAFLSSLYIGKPGSGAPNPNLYVLENIGGAGQQATSVVPVSGQTVLMVVRADFTAGNDTFRLYINPPTNGIEPSIANASKTDLDVGTVTTIDIRRQSRQRQRKLCRWLAEWLNWKIASGS
jgi:hypothetical protein